MIVQGQQFAVQSGQVQRLFIGHRVILCPVLPAGLGVRDGLWFSYFLYAKARPSAGNMPRAADSSILSPLLATAWSDQSDGAA
jgi:hypothetical protein